MMLETLDTVRTLQRKLYLKAKREPTFRFYALYDKVYRYYILEKAYRLVRSSNGSPAIDGVSFKMIEQGIGINQFLAELGKDLKEGTYKASPVMRVMIPKSDGGQRPLSIPFIKDRVAQMAVKLVIEPIFESDFVETSYGFRPKKGAHDAINEITHALLSGHTQVIDADLSKYFIMDPIFRQCFPAKNSVLFLYLPILFSYHQDSSADMRDDRSPGILYFDIQRISLVAYL